METISILSMIAVSSLMGVFFGALIMFYSMYNTEKSLLDELDAKNKKMQWYHWFIDYVYETKWNTYNQGCDWADRQQNIENE